MAVWPKFAVTHGLAHDLTHGLAHGLTHSRVEFYEKMQWSHGLAHGRVTYFQNYTWARTCPGTRLCTSIFHVFQLFPKLLEMFSSWPDLSQRYFWGFKSPIEGRYTYTSLLMIFYCSICYENVPARIVTLHIFTLVIKMGFKRYTKVKIYIYHIN